MSETQQNTGENSLADTESEEKIIEDKIQNDFQDAIERLDDIAIDADLNISEIPKDEDEGGDTPDTRSVGAESSASEKADDTKSETNSEGSTSEKTSSTKEKSKDASAKKETKKSGSVLSKLKKLTKFDKPKAKEPTKQSSKFNVIRIDKLPQIFVAKYLGKREVKGLFGLHTVRKPVDEMVKDVKSQLGANEKVELPLTYLVFSGRGIDIREHKDNNIKDNVTFGLIPIDFISYGVQDMKYWRVFTFIVVKELSSRTKQTECHAFLVDSSLNCRKMALSLGASFNVYKRKLQTQGKAHNFQVELRPPDELAEQYEMDCEA